MNPYVNKVVYDGNTLIDLTSDDALASNVLQGKSFHLATGQQVSGTASCSVSGETLIMPIGLVVVS